MSTITSRLAAAPISWGVCEVPGWGHQLDADKVLTEMTALGISATEFGPEGFLPKEAAQRAEVLKQHNLQAIGGFFPVILHDPAKSPLDVVAPELDAYEAAGASIMVLAAETGVAGYDQRHELNAEGWDLFGRNLNAIVKAAADKGIQAVVHPHVGTMIESTSDVNRVLNDTEANLCLDTGHLLIGGTDPSQLVRDYASRVGHTHLKDVHKTVAERVQAGGLSYTDGVKTGMYVPLGQGDVGIAGIVKDLLAAGYSGWFTMEQDTILETTPTGEGPVQDVRQSVAFLRALEQEIQR
ncbi:inosose dehydratase [Paenarthrobacter ureafaciens]|uniref:sugar phosphate isomerase/epimerase family protein n=1 Tax=Paenarthrobacter ureafaciens TaxID=37931 RepID=UPI0015BB5B61|nr:sugar phosphate isomerase/epimerase [Paenarthrobacter ureafaciens]NWL29291.1 inosose dehydratase [Paenarthrobacter ureafaciens]